jgi:lysyl endopeptidase
MPTLALRVRPLVVPFLAGLAVSSAALAAPQDDPVPSQRLDVRSSEEVARWAMPPVDVGALLEEDRLGAARLGVPERIGFPVTTDLSPNRLGTWEELPGGDRLWRLRLESPGALWMVLGFDSYRLQDGGRLWIYDEEKRTILGPYTVADVRDHGELWTPPIEGDAVTVELLWPKARRGETPALHLGTVSHGYKPFGSIGLSRYEKALGDSGACNIDVNCPLGNDWQDEKRGVVILLSGGTGFCTGSMINNTGNTGATCTPYVLTAAHCTAGPSTTFGFNFERSGCGSGNPGPPTTFTVTGATVRGNFASSDFTLLQMSSLPPQSFNFYFNGWNRDPSPTTSTWVIHHPSADAKKISRDGDPPINGSNWGTNHWRIDDSSADPAHRGYEEGTTEGGSSGSPLFNPAGQIIGQLHGGLASCASDTWDEYGKVAASWTGGGTPASRLSDWLDPLGTGALSQNGKNGAACFFQPAGELSVNRSYYACSDTVAISLRDDSLQGNASQAVTIASTTESTPETVILSAAPLGSGQFAGTISVASGPVTPGNGVLTVSSGDTITVTYIDADDGAGGTNVPRHANALVDCQAPAISNVQSSLVTGSTARITWTTDESSNSTVHYGTTTPPGSTASNPSLVTAHTVNLTGLTECSTYHYSVTSADVVGNAATDDSGGAYHSFATTKNVNPSFPSSGPPVAIPDNNPAGASSTITVPDTQTVVEVKVTVNITHTFDGDLRLQLIGPNAVTVPLATNRGGSGDNFTGTVFDDAAATSIASGAPPFAGSFRPETVLSALTGISAAGNWTLKVVDTANQDVGTINNWTLTLRYPNAACGPHAKYSAHTLVQDTCAAGGPGHGNGTWEAGETVEFSVTLANDGNLPLTGVSATLVPTTPGVTMILPTASYPNIGLAGTAAGVTSFKAALPASLACGTTVAFDVHVTANEGAWSSSSSPQQVGVAVLVGGTALNETFAGGIPVTWTVVDGGAGGGPAATWTTANPGVRTITSPLTAPVAIVDSDEAGDLASQDEQLVTPVLDLATATSVTLEFDQFFRWYNLGEDEKADVDVKSSATGGVWVTVLSQAGADSPNPDHKTLNITSQAAGASNVQIRFHYYDASFEWWWMVDNVKVTFVAPGPCTMNSCATPPAAPPPVPDGSFGTPMRASRSGGAIDLTWDVSSCTGADYHLLYGSLASLSSYAISGSACNLGTSGASSWPAVPAGSLWFVVVSDDDLSTEGTWGENSTGAPRGGASSSAQCSMTTRNNAGTCP